MIFFNNVLNSWIWRLYQKDWILEGLLETTSSAIHSMDVSPFDPLIAVGTQNGNLQVTFHLINFFSLDFELNSFWFRI